MTDLERAEALVKKCIEEFLLAKRAGSSRRELGVLMSHQMVELVLNEIRATRAEVWREAAEYVRKFASNKSESRKGSPFLRNTTVELLFRLADELEQCEQRAKEEA